MFTGIVQTLGTVRRIEPETLILELKNGLAGGCVEAGESISVNGCCLTAIRDASSGQHVQFDLSPETWSRTALHRVSTGDCLNLERPMSPQSLFGGHIVQGHVDATGEVVSVRSAANSTVVRFRSPAEFDRYLIDKGSIAVDGISLTVVEPVDGEFDVWVIPHTLRHTNLGSRTPGDLVNLEFDMVAKYVEKLMGARRLDSARA